MLSIRLLIMSIYKKQILKLSLFEQNSFNKNVEKKNILGISEALQAL